MNGVRTLYQEVVQTGLCTYCGTCVAACPRGVIALNVEKEEPYSTNIGSCPEKCRICYDVCPGKDVPMPDLEKIIFGRIKKQGEKEIGIYQALHKAHATDQKIREAGASGGCGTALLKYAFEAELIDGAIIAAMCKTRPWRGEARLITSTAEIFLGSQSKYTTIPVNAALAEAGEKKLERIMLTGLPCHVHGIRKGQMLGLKLFQKVKYVIGIVCGYCTSHEMTEHLITELCETELDNVSKVEYRGGQYPGHFRVTRKDGTIVCLPSVVRRLFALCFLRDRCAMCYDWGAELADLAIGDYFDASLTPGSSGLSTLIVRTDRGRNLVEVAESSGFVKTAQISYEEVLGNAGVEFKKHGFGYHLISRSRWGWPVPDFHEDITIDPLPRKIIVNHPHLMS
jgi:coenzyme F420 hydrogenase subunit beta